MSSARTATPSGRWMAGRRSSRSALVRVLLLSLVLVSGRCTAAGHQGHSDHVADVAHSNTP